MPSNDICPVLTPVHDPIDPGLTPREREILELVAEGLTNDEIATRVYLSVNSVKTYLRTAYGKVGLHRRAQAVRWVLEQRETTTCPACGRSASPVDEEPASRPELCG